MNTLNGINYFEMFGLMPKFTIDLNSLEQSFRKLQTELHPDRHVSHGDHEQRIALQLSTNINDGYRALRNPASRAQCLISLAGKEESTAALSNAFLISQMEWREAIEEAVNSKDVIVLEALLRRLKHKVNVREQDIAIALDEQADFEAAGMYVNELRFYEKLRTEIEGALDRLDS